VESATSGFAAQSTASRGLMRIDDDTEP